MMGLARVWVSGGGVGEVTWEGKGCASTKLLRGAEPRESETPFLRPREGVSLPLNHCLLFLLLDGPAPSTFDSKALKLPGRRWEGTPSWMWELDRNRGGRGKEGGEKLRLGRGLVSLWLWPRAGKDRWFRGPKLEHFPRSLVVVWFLRRMFPRPRHQPAQLLGCAGQPMPYFADKETEVQAG